MKRALVILLFSLLACTMVEPIEHRYIVKYTDMVYIVGYYDEDSDIRAIVGGEIIKENPEVSKVKLVYSVDGVKQKTMYAPLSEDIRYTVEAYQDELTYPRIYGIDDINDTP